MLAVENSFTKLLKPGKAEENVDIRKNISSGLRGGMKIIEMELYSALIKLERRKTLNYTRKEKIRYR